MEGDTIIGVPLGRTTGPQAEYRDFADSDYPRDELCDRSVKIRAADSHGQRSLASILVNRMYSWRGYSTSAQPDGPVPSKITLVASEEDTAIGTITIGLDSPTGLHVDELFAHEVDALRLAGHTVCEFTKLAMDNGSHSREVLASLFHVAYIYAYRLMGVDFLLIEVNPRHVRYYQRMLGFEVLGKKRHNPRVNAPAVLLCLDFRHSQAQIGRFGGQSDAAAFERSLYPYFFSVAEEAGIVGRLSKPSRLGAPRALQRGLPHSPRRHAVHMALQ